MEYTFADVKQYSGSLKLLYVEDEEAIRKQFATICSSIFAEVCVAVDGEDGLEKFKQFAPDLIISDVRMPKMSGLDMANQIKKINPNIPIILTTAHNEETYLIKAIDVGIDKYLLKPVDPGKLIEALMTTTQAIHDRRTADSMTKLAIEERINETCATVVGQIINASPNPLIVLNRKKLVFTNKAFTEIITTEFLNDVDNGKAFIDELLLQKDSYISSLDDLDNEDKEKVILKTVYGNKIYKVNKAHIDLPNNEIGIVYVFSDITKLEYQKLKLKHYNEHLEEFFYKKIKKERERLHKVQELDAITATTLAPRSASNSIEILDNQIKEQFGEQELRALRRSRGEKISAVDYMNEMGNDIQDALHDLEDIEVELEDQIEACSDFVSRYMIKDVAVKLIKYAAIISQLVDFEDLALAVKTLAEFLSELSPNDIDDRKFIKIKSYLDNIKADLKSWRLTNFMEQSSENIHYLDASLLSSCLQLEMLFMQQAIEDDDDLGLDLF